MRLLKRILAGISAVAIAMNPIAMGGFIAVAEDGKSVPTVSIPNSQEWCNSTAEWKINADNDTVIYYAINDDNLSDWGEYTAGQIWNSDVQIKEGEHYIKFWAVTSDAEMTVYENEAILYRYDTTEPSDFDLIEENLTIKPTQAIEDANSTNASGIAAVYYTTNGEEISLLGELEQSAEKVDIITDKDGKANFSIQLSSLEDAKNITVYAVDKAGNIRSVSSPQITTNAPTYELDVDIPLQDKWSNSIDDWKIGAVDGATVYYKTSETNEKDWGIYKDALKWNNGEQLPEGERYIKFWAVSSDTEPIVYEHDAVLYRYDRTKPNEFNLIEENLAIKPAQKIEDANPSAASGIAAVYYTTEGRKIDSLEDLEQSAKKVDVTTDRDGKVDFSIQLSNLEDAKNITVYAVDKAGNIRPVSSPQITTDDSAPWLNVETPDRNKWYRSVDEWNINTMEGATIYYKTSEVELNEEDWGAYEDATKWNNGEKLPEGKYFVKLWAVHSDSIRKVNDSVEAFYYQLDKTAPTEFTLIEGQDSFKTTLKPTPTKPNTPISDSMSGIAGVYYTIGEYEPQTIEELNQAIKDGRAKKINCEISKNVDFSLAITDDMKGQIIKVYVIDNAGNFRVASTINSGDNDIPRLENIELVSITKAGEHFEESTAHQKQPFGSEKLQDSYPFTEFYYASDVSYLKFNVIEEHQDDVIITVSVSDGKSVTFNASEMCKITNEGEEINFPYSFKADEVVNANSVGIRINEKMIPRHTTFQ